MTLYETPIMTKQTETKSTKAITTHKDTYFAINKRVLPGGQSKLK